MPRHQCAFEQFPHLDRERSPLWHVRGLCASWDKVWSAPRRPQSSRKSPGSVAMSARVLRQLTRWVWQHESSLVAIPAPMFASPLRRANSSCLWLFRSVGAPEPLGETGCSRKNKQVSCLTVLSVPPSSISILAPCPHPHPVPQA